MAQRFDRTDFFDHRLMAFQVKSLSTTTWPELSKTIPFVLSKVRSLFESALFYDTVYCFSIDQV